MLRFILIAAAALAVSCGPQAEREAAPEAEVPPDLATAFPDYRPKTTPDDLLDYRPALAAEAQGLPDATRDSLPALIERLEHWRGRAEAMPGEYVPGNVALGADPEEYEPSEAELMWALVGMRIAAFADTDPDSFRTAVPDDIGLPLTYPVFEVRHVDVMGSGRFFYVSEPEIREIGAE